MRVRAVLVAMLAVGMTAGCKNGGFQGESCLTTGDCASGYICVALTCTLAVSGYAPSGLQCVYPECAEDADCANPNFTCSGGRCVCDEDTDCLGPQTCSGGQCVDCANDGDCGQGQVCVDGFCEEDCDNNFECPPFYECQGGRCSYVGCTDHQSCSVLLRDARGRCDAGTGVCYVECVTDRECGVGGLTGNWNLQVCAGGRCEPIGCNTPEDCRVLNPGVRVEPECIDVTAQP